MTSAPPAASSAVAAAVASADASPDASASAASAIPVTVVASGPSGDPAVTTEVRRAFVNLRTKTGCANDFDYFPHGGLQNLWCHRPALLTLEKLAEAAGAPIFASGPHEPAKLDLTQPNDFGHYNPAFVHWLATALVPTHDDPYRARSQAVYDRAAKPLVHVAWAVRRKIASSPACFTSETKLYRTAIERKALPAGYYERWFFFMNPAFCTREIKGGPMDDSWYYDHGMDGGVDGNVTKSVVGFWARRTLDGTFDAFSSALDAIVAAYEPALAATP